MKLEEYIKAIEKCPDELVTDRKENPAWRLAAEYGVYDNYPILLKTDLTKLPKFLEENNYTRINLPIEKTSYKYIFSYKPGTVNLYIRDFISYGTTVDWVEGDEKLHIERQISKYNMQIMLHNYQNKIMEGMHWLRVLTYVIKDVARFAQTNSVPLCLPHSRGWDHIDDFSRVVYFDPENKEEQTI
jgi:hypothetical protein